jgi:hypothetical protein
MLLLIAIGLGNAGSGNAEVPNENPSLELAIVMS